MSDILVSKARKVNLVKPGFVVRKERKAGKGNLGLEGQQDQRDPRDNRAHEVQTVSLEPLGVKDPKVNKDSPVPTVTRGLKAYQAKLELSESEGMLVPMVKMAQKGILGEMANPGRTAK